MTKEELHEIIAIEENYRIELTTSTGDMDKFQEAICAFANDMPGSRKKGYLLIGVKNNCQIDGLKVDDALMKKIIPGAYIQYVHFKGSTNGGAILNERRFEGCLYKILPELENFIRDGIITKRPVPISILREKDVLKPQA